MQKINSKKIEHIVFDHDGTLVDTNWSGKLYPGIEQMLEKLSCKGLKLYVWTARTRLSTVEFLKSLGIITRFEDICCSTDTYPKPDPEGLKELVGGAAPESVMVVGDSMADIIGGTRYGARTIGATWASDGDSKHGQALLDAGAEEIARTIQECDEKLFDLI